MMKKSRALILLCSCLMALFSVPACGTSDDPSTNQGDTSALTNEIDDDADGDIDEDGEGEDEDEDGATDEEGEDEDACEVGRASCRERVFVGV